MTDDLTTLESDLGGRLRHTLHTVANNSSGSEAGAQPPGRRRWRRTAAVGLAAVVSVGGAAAFMAQNDDAIERLPVEHALISGEAASSEWWLLPTDAMVETCRGNPGVVLVAEQINRPGNEMNAGGVAYGEPPVSNDACAPYDEQAWLDDPGRYDMGHSRLGTERDGTPWGVYGTFHPAVSTVRVDPDAEPPFEVPTLARLDRPDGPRYIAFSLPADTRSARIELLDDEGATIRELFRSFE